MTREEAIKDLKTLKEFFEERSGAVPLSIEYAIKKLEQEPCDAVSRKEVINMLHNHAFDYATSTKISALIKTMRGEVDRMPSVTPAEEVSRSENPNKWIPVSERLPESCGMYIVTRKIYDCPDTAPIIMSDESWFDGQNTWHNDNRINHDRRYLSDVIAWMPLPEPYKSEVDE